jgi:hypothetical protein
MIHADGYDTKQVIFEFYFWDVLKMNMTWYSQFLFKEVGLGSEYIGVHKNVKFGGDKFCQAHNMENSIFFHQEAFLKMMEELW